MSSKIEHYAGLLAARGPGTGCWGESDDLPQAEWRSGVQAACCVSPTLVVCPVDKPPGEFRVRPYQDIDKGTDAQYRQVVKPTPLDPAPKRLTTEKYKKTDLWRKKVLVV